MKGYNMETTNIISNTFRRNLPESCCVWITDKEGIYSVELDKTDVSFTDFLCIISDLYETFGSRQCSFEEYKLNMIFTINANNSAQ
jgi:hypothetical protein